MMRWLLVGAVLCVASPAGTAVTVVGGGIAEACYHAAKHPSQARAGLKIRNAALDNEVLTVRNRAATLTNRGIVRLHLNAAREALLDFDRSIGLKPDLAQTYLNRSAALVRLDRFQEAVEAATKAIELDTEDVHAAYFNRAVARERLGDIHAAYYDLKAALEAKPDFRLAQEVIARYKVVSDDG